MSSFTPAVSAGRNLFRSIFFILLICALTGAGYGVSPKDRGHVPAAHRRTSAPAVKLADLQSRPSFTEEFFEPELQDLIFNVKHGMRNLIFAELRKDQPANESAAEIRRAILRRFRDAGLKKRKIRSEGYCLCFGHSFDVRVEVSPGGHSELLGVILDLDIAWGDESSLYIFQKQGKGWKIVLADEVNWYDNPEDSQSWFRYQISPRSRDGFWYVVTGSVNNHMVSRWQDVTYTALAPGADPLRPRLLARRRESADVHSADDHLRAYRFKVTTESFTVSYVHDWDDFQALWVSHAYRIRQGRAYEEPAVCHFRRLNGKAIVCPSE